MTETDAPTPAPYPAELVRAVTLKNGAHVRVRPIRPDDEPRLIDLYSRLSRYTAYQRFFTVMRRLPPDWAHFFANVDYRRRLAVVAERDTAAGVELIGVGRYEPAEEPDTAEVAFVVEDGWQGFGLGAVLLLDVVRAAQARNIRRFRAYCLADNYRMLRLLAELTDVRERQTDESVTSILFTPRQVPTSASTAGAEPPRPPAESTAG